MQESYERRAATGWVRVSTYETRRRAGEPLGLQSYRSRPGSGDYDASWISRSNQRAGSTRCDRGVEPKTRRWPSPKAHREDGCGGGERDGTPDPWGDPDLQGIWSNTTTTPLERPSNLAGKQVLTSEERAERDALRATAADRPPRPGDTGSYNAFWGNPARRQLKRR
jgi:hypothetical protein